MPTNGGEDVVRVTKYADSDFWVRVHSLRAYLMASEQISQMRGER